MLQPKPYTPDPVLAKVLVTTLCPCIAGRTLGICTEDHHLAQIALDDVAYQQYVYCYTTKYTPQMDPPSWQVPTT